MLPVSTNLRTSTMGKILDTHIHLWPGTAVLPTNHGWMTPGHFLAKQHGIDEYAMVTRSTSPSNLPLGFLYIETDRYLPSPRPDLSSCDSEQSRTKALKEWAKEPLEELHFIRRIVESNPNSGDGFHSNNSNLMLGCVIWAPFHLPTDLFDLYLQIAEEVSGPQLWDKVVGFRYLIQGIRQEEEMRNLVLSETWLQNTLRLRMGRAGKGWVFDIGVDTHGGGAWQLEVAADMVDRIRAFEGDERGVVFVLNHLCKPDLSSSPTTSWPEFSTWKSTLARLASHPGVYMKYSGGFNEFAPAATPSSASEIFEKSRSFIEHIFNVFGPRKVMFGSDWPVCNVGGPNGEENWGLWREVVAKSIENYQESEKEYVWWKAGSEAYGIDI